MTVQELKNYLEGLCYEGKQHFMVRFAEDPFESPHFYLAPFSVTTPEAVQAGAGGFVTLSDRDSPKRVPDGPVALPIHSIAN